MDRCYDSDVSDEQWELVRPLIEPRTGVGNRRKYPLRQVLNAVLYVVRTGVQWRYLPKDFPPWRRVHDHFIAWTNSGTLERIHTVLRDHVRRVEGRELSPTAAMMDSQTVHSTAGVGTTTGFDGAKRRKGRKRHVVTDTLGLVLVLLITAANVADSTAAHLLLPAVHARYPSVEHIWADGGYNSKVVARAPDEYNITVEVVPKLEGQKGFVSLPRRWVVERTFGWFTAHRRLARDYEKTPESSAGMIYLAMSRIMLNRLAP